MLPSKPQIFHGRDVELHEIVKMLCEESPRIAILGAGGMGKTSLARATLHHPDITTKYEHRFFVACDSANTSIEIAALLGAHLGLKPAKDLTKPVIQHLSKRPSPLLILDNLETPWEPKEARGRVEEFLSLLTEIQHLALIITMRGAERPQKVRWTRPFLLPLKPLGDDAAWQTFIDIAEDSHKHEDINSLLHLTDNMPLALDLVAHLVSWEGCPNVLNRWETERTSLLSQGHNKRSSLDASIALSLSSPRMTSGAKELLRLLSILPDGLSDLDLVQCKPSIPDILQCKATLLGNTLAYTDDANRLKSLVPIREHVLHFDPPSSCLTEPLWKYFQSHLDLYQRYVGQTQMASKLKEITAHLGNMKQVLSRALHSDNPDLAGAIDCTISLNSFFQITGHGWLDLMDVIPSILPQPPNPRLEARFILETLRSSDHYPMSAEELMAWAASHFHNIPGLEGKPLTRTLFILLANLKVW
ncbi:P-loop containing nucleoside triphosphate hydrolase protein [Mycena latifolia]|nr:P-loop containing nucleoside triphosphate hydrolase protein [Mycena latifolia]